jgi:hypothetical protein
MAMSAVVIGALALPGVASGAFDLAITQTESATVVDKGGLVNFSVDVENVGTENDEAVFAELGSLAAFARGADTPFQSFSTSQGTCADRSAPAFGTVYHFIVCELGALAPGASAHISATVKVNQSAVFSSFLLPNAFEGGYTDANNSNNHDGARVTASSPPVITGSPKIKVTGLPKGCASDDFTFTARAKVPGVKKMKAVLFYWEGSEGVTWTRVAKGNRLKAKVPVSRLPNELGKTYKLKIKAKRGGGKRLTRTVEFELC